VIGIDENPVEWCGTTAAAARSLADSGELANSQRGQVTEIADRAQRMLPMEADEEEWSAISRFNAKIPTTLGSLGPQAVARLLYHGYWLTRAKCTVLLGYGTDVPESDRDAEYFGSLCLADPTASDSGEPE
jgi:hypothetical protein